MLPQRLLLLSLLALSLLTLAACSASPSWFRGDWVVDVDRSQKEMADNNPPPPPATNQNLFGDLASRVSSLANTVNNSMGSLALQSMSGMEFIVTDKDILSLTNGQGKSLSYEIVQKTPDSIMIKESDGSVETFFRGDNDSLYTCPSGANFKIYFRRKTGS